MQMSRLLLSAFLPLALVEASAAHATTINGAVYCNLASSDASNTPVPGATLSSGTLCATFTSSSINFQNTNTNTNTVGNFLNSGSIVGNITYYNGYTASSNLDYSLFEFTGAAYFTNGQTYSATHDDGTVMKVNGTTVINAPGPTSSHTDTFTFAGTSGVYNFAYNFTEVQGATVYNTDATQSPVPEPAGLLLIGTGAAGAFGVRRYRMDRS